MDKYPRLSDYPYVVPDTETTGLDWKKDHAFAVAIALPDDRAFYYDLRREQDRNYIIHELPKARKFVNHHIKFDIHMLREAGVNIDKDQCRCTMIAAALLNEHEPSYGLDALAVRYVGVGKVDDIWPKLADMFGGAPTRKAQIGNLHRAPYDLAAKYAIGDVVATLKLYRWQMQEIKNQGLEEVYKLEHALLPVLVEMERHGVRIDVERAEDEAVNIERSLKDWQHKLNNLAGTAVNANSPPQVKKLLVDNERSKPGAYYAIDGTPLELTDAGQPSMGADTLRKIKSPIAEAVLQIRSLDKTLNTFLRGHILGYSKGGRVHCNYNQTKSDNDRGTGTGRLSVNSPALQQIHKRDKVMAAHVRSCFVPDEGQLWASLDWSQMDFRIFAHYAKEPQILEMYQKNPDADYHGMVAELVGLPRDRTPGTGGGNAKQINLGLVFGMQPGRMAQEMGLPFTVEKTRSGNPWVRPGEEATAVFEKYHRAIPGVQKLLDKARAKASREPYTVHTSRPVRRAIRFPGGQFTHKAAGLVFQGTAADCLKHKLVEVHKIVKGTGAHLLINVHDEFDLSVPEDPSEYKPLLQEVKNEVERFGPDDYIPLRVPIRSSLGMGPNWWVASGVDDGSGYDWLYRRKNK